MVDATYFLRIPRKTHTDEVRLEEWPDPFANPFEPRRYHNVVGPFRFKSKKDDTVVVHTHFMVAHIDPLYGADYAIDQLSGGRSWDVK